MRATTVLDAPSNLGLRPSLAASGCVDPDLDPDGRRAAALTGTIISASGSEGA